VREREQSATAATALTLNNYTACAPPSAAGQVNATHILLFARAPAAQSLPPTHYPLSLSWVCAVKGEAQVNFDLRRLPTMGIKV